MHATLKPPGSPKGSSGPLSSRTASVVAAVVAAAIAGLLIVVFLQKYRDDVSADAVPTPVLVAGKLIEQGASGESIGAQARFTSSQVPRDTLKPGALTDAAALRGQVAVADILPGQQLTAANFRPAGSGVVTKLAANERAITIAVDSAHALGGQLTAGDRVDVLTGFLLDSGSARQRPVLKTLMEDVLVLSVPAAVGDSVGARAADATLGVTLRVAAGAATTLAFAADNGRIWLTLRPQNGRNAGRSPLVSVASLLADGPVLKGPAGGAPAR